MSPTDLPEKLASQIAVIESGCWEWQGKRGVTGYGLTKVKNSSYMAHRVVYQLLVGSIPPGLELDHLCRNRACVNPSHLEPVTHHENLRRSPVSLGSINQRKTHCPLGHPYDIFRAGGRRCRTCLRAQRRAARERDKAAHSVAIAGGAF